MVQPQYRYACTKCAYGWHDTPYCPGDAARLTFSAMSEMDLRHEIRRREKQERQRQGLPEPRWEFRWWWIPLGLAIWIALIILI